MKIKDVFKRFPELKCFIYVDKYTDEYHYKYEKYRKDNKILLLKEKNEIVEFYIMDKKESKLVKFKDVPSYFKSYVYGLFEEKQIFIIGNYDGNDYTKVILTCDNNHYYVDYGYYKFFDEDNFRHFYKHTLKESCKEYFLGKLKQEKWYKLNNLHRENGPAVIIYNNNEKISDKIYCLNGKKCNEFQKEVIKQLEEN